MFYFLSMINYYENSFSVINRQGKMRGIIGSNREKMCLHLTVSMLKVGSSNQLIVPIWFRLTQDFNMVDKKYKTKFKQNLTISYLDQNRNIHSNMKLQCFT